MNPAKQPYGSERPPAWASLPSQWSEPGAALSGPIPASAAAPGGAPGMARTGLLVLVAVLTELVIVAAAANQWVSRRIADDSIGAGSFWHRFEQSWLTYNWRVAPHSNATREFAAQLALDVTTFVISGLLIFALVRAARATFWRAFLASWLSVLVATLLGAFVRGLVLPKSVSGLPIDNPVSRALFGPAGPSQLAVVGGATLGLLTALVVGTVAVLTRRPVEEAAPAAPPAAAYEAAPEQPPPYYGEHPSGAPAAPHWQDQHFEPHGRHAVAPPAAPPAAAPQPDDQPTTAYQPVSGEQPTTAYRPVSGEQPTTAYQPPPPREYQGGGQQPGSPTEGLPAAQFPRPPEEEDPDHA